jgi:hypothetical protein
MVRARAHRLGDENFKAHLERFWRSPQMVRSRPAPIPSALFMNQVGEAEKKSPSAGERPRGWERRAHAGTGEERPAGELGERRMEEGQPSLDKMSMPQTRHWSCSAGDNMNFDANEIGPRPIEAGAHFSTASKN